MTHSTEINETALTLTNKKTRNYLQIKGHHTTFWDICRGDEVIGQLSKSNGPWSKWRVLQANPLEQEEDYIHEQFTTRIDALIFASQYL